MSKQKRQKSISLDTVKAYADEISRIPHPPESASQEIKDDSISKVAEVLLRARNELPTNFYHWVLRQHEFTPDVATKAIKFMLLRKSGATIIRTDPTAESPCVCCGTVDHGFVGMSTGIICKKCMFTFSQAEIEKYFIDNTWWFINDDNATEWEKHSGLKFPTFRSLVLE